MFCDDVEAFGVIGAPLYVDVLTEVGVKERFEELEAAVDAN